MLMGKTTFNYDAGDIVNFKCISGDEILAKIIEERDEVYILSKPVSLLKSPEGGLGMMGIPIGADPEEPIVLNKFAIAFHVKCHGDLAKHYLANLPRLEVDNN